jgi:hypothetical protein
VVIRRSNKKLRDLSWLRPDVVTRLNHFRHRAGEEDLTEEQFKKWLKDMDETEYLSWISFVF